MQYESTVNHPSGGRFDRFCHVAIETLLLCAVALSPWAFGAVEPWAMGLLQGTAAAVLVIWSIRVLAGGRSSFSGRAPLVMTALFAAVLAIQIIPLPDWIHHILAPGGTELRESLVPTAMNAGSLEGPSSFSTLSIGWEKTFSGLLELVAYCALFLAAIAHFKENQSIQRLLRVVVGTGSALALFGIAQKLAGNGKIYWFVELTRGGNPFGPYVNRNHFAGYVEMAALVAMGTFAYQIGKWSHDRGGLRFNLPSFLSERDGASIVFLGLGAAVMISAIFFSLSRGGMVSITIGCLVFCLGFLKRPRVIFVLGMFLVVATSLAAWLGGTELANRIATLDQLHWRLDLWKSCSALILAFPAFGVGTGNFVDVIPSFQTFAAHQTFRYAESDWWHFTSELGFTGLLLILTSTVIFGRRLVKGWPHKRRTQTQLLGLSAAIIAICVHGFVDFNLHIPANALLFLLLVAAAWNLSVPSQPKPSAVPACSIPS